MMQRNDAFLQASGMKQKTSRSGWDMEQVAASWCFVEVQKCLPNVAVS